MFLVMNHLYKALFWKFLWSLKNRFIYILIFITIPILVALLLSYVLSSKTEITEVPAKKTTPLESKKLYSLPTVPLDILYTPISDEADKIMNHVKTLLKTGKVNGEQSEASMELWFIQNHKDADTKNLSGYGIIFNEINTDNLIYTLRSTSSSNWNTNSLFPSSLAYGPGEIGNYAEKSFISVQAAINSGYTIFLGLTEKEWYMQNFPYPAYRVNTGFLLMSYIVSIALAYGFLPLQLAMLVQMSKEKKSGARELLTLNGVKKYMIFIYWGLYYLVLYLIVVTLITIILKVLIFHVILFENSNAFLLWFMLMLYTIASMALIMFLCEIFNSVAFSSVLFMNIITIIFVIIVTAHVQSISFFGFVLMLLPFGSLYYGISTFLFYEASGTGLGFNNMFSVDKTLQSMYFLTIIMLVLSTILFALLTLYVSLIKPGEFGRARPWYFICPKFIQNKFERETSIEFEEHNVEPMIENINMEPGISVRNLYKIFGKFKAVNNLSIDIYKNQITALLGHNGAGKSTFLFTITGIISPTSGEVIYDDYNIFENLALFRQSIGFCPQLDILLMDMSVKEQIAFFGMVKGFTKEEAIKKAEDLMENFSLEHRSNVKPSQLSGGMKRKVSLAIALVNNPSVLFLDEPTSGLDPESRRNLWDILLNLREGRTVVITTHFMEEADVLGDKIAIMAHGEIRCYGSAMFLKKQYGSGHKITVSYKEEDPEKIKKIMSVASSVVENNKKITFNIPMEETSKLSQLMASLEKYLDKDSQISVSCTSMEDVFLKVQEGEGISTAFKQEDIEFIVKKQPKNTGISCILQQFWALIIKRILYLRFAWLLSLIMFLLIPILGALLFIHILRKMAGQPSPPFELVLSKYGSTKAVIGGSGDKVQNTFVDLIKKEGSTIFETKQAVDEELRQISESDLAEYRNSYLIGGDFFKSPTVLFSTVAYHTSGIAINLIYNAIIQSEKQSTIKTTNHPYEFNSDMCQMGVEGTMKIYLIALLFSVTLLISLSAFSIFPIKERIVGFKHLQYMTGLKPIIYWISNILFDTILYFLVLCIVIFMLYILDTYQFFRKEILSVLMLFMLVYAISVILLCYLASFVLKGSDSATTIIILSLIMISVLGLILFLIANIGDVSYAFYISPLSPFVSSMVHILNKAQARVLCSKCPTYQKCDDVDDSVLSIRELQRDLYILLIDIAIFFILLLLFDYNLIQYGYTKLLGPKLKTSDENEDNDVLEEKERVKNLTLKEEPNRIRGGGGKSISDKSTSKSQKSDSYLLKNSNKNKVLPDDSISTGSTTTETISDSLEEFESIVLLVDGLAKQYRHGITALENVTFVCKKGQCFGLLGVSGAGKSTAFSMISGTSIPTKGTAMIISQDKKYKLGLFIYSFIKNIGYCPQENWVLDNLTARQLMTHFAHLRGIDKSVINDTIDWWIQMLDLHLYCDKPFINYSGGNKRKLSTSLALIGEPLVIMMDEPSTGVDPVTRRKLWQVFKLIKYTDQTMILTSHSMDECEAVCDKLTILVNGKMVCIGDIEYLKHKYALGSKIFIKLDVNTPDNIVQNIKTTMVKSFGSKCDLTDQYKGFLNYQIGEKDIKWSKIFLIMESIKKSFTVIEEYMVSDTSLEQVFLSFAKDANKEKETKENKNISQV